MMNFKLVAAARLVRPKVGESLSTYSRSRRPSRFPRNAEKLGETLFPNKVQSFGDFLYAKRRVSVSMAQQLSISDIDVTWREYLGLRGGFLRKRQDQMAADLLDRAFAIANARDRNRPEEARRVCGAAQRLVKYTEEVGANKVQHALRRAFRAWVMGDITKLLPTVKWCAENQGNDSPAMFSDAIKALCFQKGGKRASLAPIVSGVITENWASKPRWGIDFGEFLLDTNFRNRQMLLALATLIDFRVELTKKDPVKWPEQPTNDEWHALLMVLVHTRVAGQTILNVFEKGPIGYDDARACLQVARGLRQNTAVVNQRTILRAYQVMEKNFTLAQSRLQMLDQHELEQALDPSEWDKVRTLYMEVFNAFVPAKGGFQLVTMRESALLHRSVLEKIEWFYRRDLRYCVRDHERHEKSPTNNYTTYETIGLETVENETSPIDSYSNSELDKENGEPQPTNRSRESVHAGHMSLEDKLEEERRRLSVAEHHVEPPSMELAKHYAPREDLLAAHQRYDHVLLMILMRCYAALGGASISNLRRIGHVFRGRELSPAIRPRQFSFFLMKARHCDKPSEFLIDIESWIKRGNPRLIERVEPLVALIGLYASCSMKEAGSEAAVRGDSKLWTHAFKCYSRCESMLEDLLHTPSRENLRPNFLQKRQLIHEYVVQILYGLGQPEKAELFIEKRVIPAGLQVTTRMYNSKLFYLMQYDPYNENAMQDTLAEMQSSGQIPDKLTMDTIVRFYIGSSFKELLLKPTLRNDTLSAVSHVLSLAELYPQSAIIDYTTLDFLLDATALSELTMEKEMLLENARLQDVYYLPLTHEERMQRLLQRIHDKQHEPFTDQSDDNDDLHE